MGWTTPATQPTGTLITAAMYAAIQNDLAYLYQRPAAKLMLDATQLIANNSLTALTWKQAYAINNSVVPFVTRGGTSTVLTIPEAGIYQVTAQVRFAANATGVRQALFTGAGAVAAFDIPANGGADPTIAPLSDLWSLSAGDTIGVSVYQNSGGNLNVDASGTFIAAVRVA